MSICPEGAPTSLLVQEPQLHPVCVSAPWMLMGSFPTGPPRTHPRSGGKRRFLGESSHSLAPLSGFCQAAGRASSNAVTSVIW